MNHILSPSVKESHGRKEISFLLFMIFFYCCKSEEISCDNTQVWGPGLDPENVIMPARYFFIKAYDDNNNSVSSSPGKDFYQVQIRGEDERLCRVWLNILDANDGLFIVRYKVHTTCSNLRISIKCKGKDLPNSPFVFSAVTYPDDCSCLVKDDINDWLKKYKCEKKFTQIRADLEKFNEIDFDFLLPVAEKTLFKDTLSKSVCHYLIKDNKVYRKCYGQYTGFKMFVDAILLFFTRKVRLPDMEMLFNLGDWPLIKKKPSNDTIVPLFSWCGSEDSHDIVIPTYDITESSLENMGRVTMDMLSVQGSIAKTWNDKIKKLFWRGRDSSRERLSLISLSRQHNDIINASLTDFFFFKDLEHKYGPKENRISFFNFFDYKYQMNMDGTVAAYRFPYLLVSDSLVFKQESSYYEHFYKELKEWEHFVPVKRDLSDLIEKVKWAIDNDQNAREIAVKGQQFARTNLLPHAVFCYHAQLFEEYRKKFVAKNISVRPGMEEVKQNMQKQCQCSDSKKISSSRISEDL